MQSIHTVDENVF